MPDADPVACSLEAGALKQRLSLISEVGAGSLISATVDGDRHLLRFQAGADTRRRLEAIVAGEAECCSFLDLSLTEENGQLLLSISAPGEGGPIGDELARAFSRHAGP